MVAGKKGDKVRNDGNKAGERVEFGNKFRKNNHSEDYDRDHYDIQEEDGKRTKNETENGKEDERKIKKDRNKRHKKKKDQKEGDKPVGQDSEG